MSIPELDTPIKRAVAMARMIKHMQAEIGLTGDDLENIRESINLPPGIPLRQMRFAPGQGKGIDDIRALLIMLDGVLNFLAREDGREHGEAVRR
jgi:hypothetical protein